MKTLYHGTTRENWKNIQKEGWLGGSYEPVWNCSMREIYFFDTAKIDDDNACDYTILRQAFEQAQIAAAVHNYHGIELVVLRFEIPDELVEDDFSCNNASESSTVHPDYMEKAELTGVYVSDNYNPSLRLFYICGLLANNDFINLTAFSELEIEAARMLSSNNFFIDDLFDHEWNTEMETAAA